MAQQGAVTVSARGCDEAITRCNGDRMRCYSEARARCSGGRTRCCSGPMRGCIGVSKATLQGKHFLVTEFNNEIFQSLISERLAMEDPSLNNF